MFERGESDKGANMTSEIMKIELQRRYPDDYDLPIVPYIKSYVRHMINNNCSWVIIYVDDP